MNVISDDGRAEGARGAEMSASSFALTRVPPALGRALTAADEVVGAPEVVVVGGDGCEPAMRSANLPRASASMVRL